MLQDQFNTQQIWRNSIFVNKEWAARSYAFSQPPARCLARLCRRMWHHRVAG